MEAKLTYIDAYDELQQIVKEIELGAINVDDLALKISRAAQLISICKAKLVASEEEVEKLLQQLSQEKEVSNENMGNEEE